MIRFTRTSLFVVGVTLILLAFVAYQVFVLARCNRTTGTVVRYDVKSDDVYFRYRTGKVESLYPVIMFNDGDRDVEFHGEENVMFAVGETVPVLYHRSNPETAYVYTFWSFWFHPILLLPVIVLGAVVIGVGKNGSFWTLYWRNFKIVRTEVERRRD